MRELTAAFRKFSKDLSEDMVFELQEAADPVRKATEQYITQGGGGFPGMRNMPLTPYYVGMRIGVSNAKGVVYIAPDWRARGSGTPRGSLGTQLSGRMQAAVEDKAEEVTRRMGHFLDTLADEWGSQLAA